MSEGPVERSDALLARLPIWEQLEELAAEADRNGLRICLDALSELDRARAFGRLTAEARGRVVALLEPEHAAALLEAMHDVHAAEAVEEMSPATAAEILEELPSDERADLIGQLTPRAAEAILAKVAPATAETVRDLLQYPPDTAGGLMITEFVAVPDTDTVEGVVARLRGNVELYANYIVQYVYVVGSSGELRGVLPLRNLLLSPSGRPVESLMLRDPISVAASTPWNELEELFDRLAFVGVPVVDAAERLVGIVLREDIDEARLDRADAATRKARGIVGGEELRSLPWQIRSRRRLSWLSVNIVLNVIAASVIALYQDTLQAVIALAVFLPIISDMSGCSGNQAVAVSLRELTLGVTRPSDIARVLMKESGIGIVNGVVLGALIGGVAFAWQGNLVLGLVVGTALALNTVVAVCIGGIVPLVLRRAGYDPALASSPMLTTITDLCGFFFVLSFATLVLSHLTT